MITFEQIEQHQKAMVGSDGKFSTSDRYKLLKMIDRYIDQKDYSPENLKKIQYMFYYYCMNGVKSQLVDKVGDSYTTENSVKPKIKFDNLDFVDTYKKLMLLDKKRNTVLWSERNVCFLNYHEPSRKFLQNNQYNTSRLEEQCWKYLNKNLIEFKEAISDTEYEKKLEKIKTLCPTYINKIEWSKQTMNSHFMVLMAIDCKHDLNQKQIQDYFQIIKPNLDKDVEQRVNYFAKILQHSSLFKNNITQYKDLKISLGKMFGVTMNVIKEYKEDLSVMQKFIFLLAENPILKHDNMKTKLEKKEKIRHFGKPFLNEEESQEYIKMKEKRTIETKTKKLKI